MVGRDFGPRHVSRPTTFVGRFRHPGHIFAPNDDPGQASSGGLVRLAFLGFALLDPEHPRCRSEQQHDNPENSDLPQLIPEGRSFADRLSAAFTDSTTISLIEAMMPTSRNGSATSSRLAMVIRTAESSSTRMNSSSNVSSTSTTGLVLKSSNTSRRSLPATPSSTTDATSKSAAMPRYTTFSMASSTASARLVKPSRSGSATVDIMADGVVATTPLRRSVRRRRRRSRRSRR